MYFHSLWPWWTAHCILGKANLSEMPLTTRWPRDLTEKDIIRVFHLGAPDFRLLWDLYLLNIWSTQCVSFLANLKSARGTVGSLESDQHQQQPHYDTLAAKSFMVMAVLEMAAVMGFIQEEACGHHRWCCRCPYHWIWGIIWTAYNENG